MFQGGQRRGGEGIRGGGGEEVVEEALGYMLVLPTRDLPVGIWHLYPNHSQSRSPGAFAL